MTLAAILTAWLAAQAAAPPAPPPPEPAPAPAPVAPAPQAPVELVELTWDAPPGCPTADAVRASIARGIPSAAGGVARVRAGVVVTPVDAEHWRAAVELRGADWEATRTLKGPTCAAVADAASLVIVLALATELKEREVVIEAPAPLPPPPPPEEVTLISSPVAGANLVVDMATLPSATFGAGIAVGWRWEHGRADLRGALFRDRSGTLADQPGTGVELSLLSASLRGCYVRGRVVALGPCVAAGVDRLSGRGFGALSTTEATNIAPFLAPGLLVEWHVARRVVAFVSAEAAIPLVRARFSIEHVGQVHQPASASFRGAAGLEWRFR
jgi:hypothetical protein